MFEFLRILIAFFDRNNIDYMLSGSVAMSIYTVPRFTRDFDFVVHLRPENISVLTETFKEGYYADEDAIRDAIENRSMFNIIDHKSSYKADFMVLKNEAFRINEFERRGKVRFLDMEISIVSAEDLLLSKIIWIQDIQSGVQQEDIKALWELESLDKDYVKNWAARLNLNTFGLLND